MDNVSDLAETAGQSLGALSIDNPPGAMIRRQQATAGTVPRRTASHYGARGVRPPLDAVRAGLHNLSAGAYETMTGYAKHYGYDDPAGALHEALFGPASMQNVRYLTSPQGLARELRDMGPANIALGTLLFGKSFRQGPVMTGYGGRGGGGGDSGLLQGGGPRGLPPGGPYPGLGRGTGLNLPQGSSERIAYPNSRIWTGQ